MLFREDTVTSDVIECGVIQSKDQKITTYEIRIADKKDLDQILSLQNQIVSEIKHSELFQPDSEEFIRCHFEGKGRIFGVYSHRELIAYLLIAIPKDDPHHLGVDIPICETEYSQVAHIETVVVHPLFRGNALQLKLLFQAEQFLKKQGLTHVCATVSPYNYWSLKNFLKNNLYIKNIKPKYSGKIRYILHKDLRNLNQKNEIFLDTVSISNNDFLKQRDMLQKGFWGYGVEKQAENSFMVRFGINQSYLQTVISQYRGNSANDFITP